MAFCDCRWRQLSTSVWYRSFGKRWKYSAANFLAAVRSQGEFLADERGALMILAPRHAGKGRHTFQCLDCDRLDPLKSVTATGWLKGELQPPK
jgi:hypothetical protein